MSIVLAGFCAVNCWVIPKLWEPRLIWRHPVLPGPPKGGIVVRIRPPVRPSSRTAAQPALQLAA